MSLSEPSVSVTLITYNHEQYIGQAIQSVLDQTHKDLELVVVNDGSTDDTARIIDGFSDPRVRVFHQKNQGPSVTGNRALAACRGRYVAMMSGDDLLPPRRIEKQLAEYLKGGSRVLFSDVAFIDEHGVPTKTDYYASNLTPAHGRAQVLRRLFEGRCPVFILTLFTEARILKAEPQYCDPALYQLQDYELLLRLAKKYDFAHQDEALYTFRLRGGHVNLSGPEPGKIIRTRNEFYIFMQRFFDDIPPDLFKEIFPGLAKNPGFSSPAEYQCEQAFAFLRGPTAALRRFGAEKLYQLLAEAETRGLLERSYHFTHVTFAELLKSIDAEKLYPDQSSLFLDTGVGFNADENLVVPANNRAEEFTLTFDLSAFPTTRALRWDPVEGSRCKVRLGAVTYRDASGQATPLDLRTVTSNGISLPDGSHLFATTDPMFFLPGRTGGVSVTVQGSWWVPLEVLDQLCSTTALVLDTGQGFDGQACVRKLVYLEGEEFGLTFDVSRLAHARALCWQPVEGCPCAVQISSVTYGDSLGKATSLDLGAVTSNGTPLEDGTHLFATATPLFFFPGGQDVALVTIRGHWLAPLSRKKLALQQLLSPDENEADRTAEVWKHLPARALRWLRKVAKRAARAKPNETPTGRAA